MMDGIQTMLKFLLIFFNFVIFVSIFICVRNKVFNKSNILQVVGVVVFGIAVWVIVDAPKFTELFDKARV